MDSRVSSTKKLIQTSLLLAIGIIFQVIGRNVPEINQFLVGPVINCILILAAVICGRWWGVGAGLLTPVMALLVGQLSAPLAPFIPFIMTGNAIFVLLFSIFQESKLVRRAGAVIIGAAAKYAFLAFSASKLISLFGLNFPPKIAKALVISMGIPQLVTALGGGALALILIEILSRRKVI